MKGIFLKESLKLIINIILVVGAAMMIIESMAGQRDEQTIVSEEKKSIQQKIPYWQRFMRISALILKKWIYDGPDGVLVEMI